MPKDSFLVKIGLCANPKCGNVHIEITEGLYTPDTFLVFSPEDARRLAGDINAFLDKYFGKPH